MKISILLPYKENFAHNYAGAVSLFVNDITRENDFRKTTRIFSHTISKKKLSKELRHKLAIIEDYYHSK